MVYETPSHISSLLRYLHPNGMEEHLLIHAIVNISREISKGMSGRTPQHPSAAAASEGKKVHGNTKNKTVAAKTTALVIPDSVADAEGSFVARQLMCLSMPHCSQFSVSSCVAPGVGYSDLSTKRNGDNSGLGAISLFGTPEACADGELISDGEEQLISRHWLPVFLRRRRFSNQVRLYQNSLYFSGFRSLCLQAHCVNRLISPLASMTAAKSCFDEILSASNSCQDTRRMDCVSHVADDASMASPMNLQGSLPNEHVIFDMPGIYHPILFLKAHVLRLSHTITSIVKHTVECKQTQLFCFIRRHLVKTSYSGRIFHEVAGACGRI
jgi:hypothetical protein